MRVILLLLITWAVVAPDTLTTALAAQANRVTVSYVLPKNSAHQPIYEQLKEVRFLERLQRWNEGRIDVLWAEACELFSGAERERT